MTQRREPGFGPDIHQPRLELDAQENLQPHITRHRRIVSLPILAILILLLGAVAYALIGHVGQAHVTEGGIPVILADPTPVRVRPEQPGGMEIPFQDTTVYDELSSGRKHAVATTEHLLASPEQPLPKPEAPAPKPDIVADPAAQTPSPAATTVPPASENEAVLAPQFSQPPIPAVATDSSPGLLPPPPVAAPKHAKAALADDGDTSDADDKPVPIAPKLVKPPAAASFHSEIQLGAYKDASVAENQWQKLAASHGDELGALTHRVERADLGDKGIWYRLKAGPLDDAHARQDCTVLKADGVTCFVPGK